MPGIISESYLSRPFTLGLTAGRELEFDIMDTDDEVEVYNLLVGPDGGPAAYLGLARESLEARPLGGGVWKGYVRYVNLVGTSEYTFDTGGGSDHITQSLSTMGSYAPAGLVAPDFHGAIGVSEDRVDGVDIPSRAFEFSETHYLTDLQVTSAYKLILFSLTGRFNNASFKGLAAGECLLLGVSGAKRGDERWGLTYRFSCSPNAASLTVGGITGIVKRGWDYLWMRYADAEDSSAFALVKRPIAAYVEQVHEAGDFSLLGIGT